MAVYSNQTVIPVVKGVSYFLAHVPSMVRYGSKPSRELANTPSLLPSFLSHLETFEQAVAYPPNQVFIGNLDPDELWNLPSPWYKNPMSNASRLGDFGEIMPEEEFYGILKLCDQFELIKLEKEFRLEIDVRDDPNLRRTDFVIRSSKSREDLTHLAEG